MMQPKQGRTAMQSSDKLYSYKVYFHGEFVGTVPAAMTEGEAIVWFANRNREYNPNGMMAVQSR